jgi:hypothetical protein
MSSQGEDRSANSLDYAYYTVMYQSIICRDCSYLKNRALCWSTK